MNKILRATILCGLCVFGMGLEKTKAWECVEVVDKMTGEPSDENT